MLCEMGKGSVDRFCSKQGRLTREKGVKGTQLAIKKCKQAAKKKKK